MKNKIYPLTDSIFETVHTQYGAVDLRIYTLQLVESSLYKIVLRELNDDTR